MLAQQLRIIHPDVISLFDRDRDLRTGVKPKCDTLLHTPMLLILILTLGVSHNPTFAAALPKARR